MTNKSCYALALKNDTAPYAFFTNTGFQFLIYSDEKTAETERKHLTPSLANDLKVIKVELSW